MRTYIAIDLKSFYASVECMDRGLDPMTTNLVVADPERTEKTICLAVSPALKAYGIPGRARLFEVVQKVKEVNIARARKAKAQNLTPQGFSDNAEKLQANPALQVTWITAPPRMLLYEQISTQIYSVYLKYISHEDIHVYSIGRKWLWTSWPSMSGRTKTASGSRNWMNRPIGRPSGATAR